MPSIGERCSRRSTRSTLRSSPFHRPKALSCVFHGWGITYRTGFRSLPSTTPRWPESLPCLEQRCPLPLSRHLGAHPMRPSRCNLWPSCLLNSGSWRSGTHGLSGLLLGPPLGRARLADYLDEATRQFGGSWLHGVRWMLSWRPYGLRLRGSGTWCWTMLMGRLLWWHLCPL
jgi:hypothetical protein